MHYTTRLIFLAALCGLTAHAQIIKSNVFTRKDLTSAANKATARALLGISEWVTNSVPSYTNIVQSYTNIVADLTALAAYSGADDIVLVSDANTGGTFARTTGLAADGVIVVTNTAAGSVFKRQYTGPADFRWWNVDQTGSTDVSTELQAALDAAS
jgi:hypothetical protein